MSSKYKQKKRPEPSAKGLFPAWALALAVFLAALILYWPARNHQFTNWDDKEYVTHNPDIQKLDAQAVKYHFGREHMGNYHPLSMLSLALDYRIGGLDPKVFHTTNLLLHALASLAAFAFVRALTASAAAAFISAMLFAIHPMHVESVAWVSERKDVLYGFFLLSALWAYVNYASAPEKKHKISWYAVFSALFILSLLSKAQAVIFPVLCLLIDYFKGRGLTRPVMLEKAPLFALSLIFGLEAIHAQQTFEAIQDTSVYSYFDRILFSGYGLFTYLWKLAFPVELSAFYPYPLKIDGKFPLIFYITPVVSAGLIFIVWRFFRQNRLIVFGCLFFLASIGLVLQVLPVGGAVIAERYTYIPYLGLFMIAAHYLSDWKGMAGKITTAAILCVFALLAHNRIGIWENSLALWKDAERKSKISPKIYLNLGTAYMDASKYDSALIYTNEALRLQSKFPDALHNRGLIYYHTGRYEEAIADYTLALEYNPRLMHAWYNRSGVYWTLKQFKPALDDAIRARELGYPVDPKYIEALQQALNTK
ncbi:MAG: tetratricopeptide repeat protein [Bacteroidota bacterium]